MMMMMMMMMMVAVAVVVYKSRVDVVSLHLLVLFLIFSFLLPTCREDNDNPEPPTIPCRCRVDSRRIAADLRVDQPSAVSRSNQLRQSSHLHMRSFCSLDLSDAYALN